VFWLALRFRKAADFASVSSLRGLSIEVGVGHEPSSVPLVRRADARGLDRLAPHGVAQGFQITSHSGEPCSRSRNLLSKDDWRASLRDEAAELGPEVALVVEAALLTGNTERLAGTRAGPDGLIVRPSGKSKGVGPAADAGEEVALSESSKVCRRDVGDASLIDHPIRDVAGSNQVPQPCRRVGVDFVVVRGHSHLSTF